jgi:Family of unknown function (DUF6982)
MLGLDDKGSESEAGRRAMPAAVANATERARAEAQQMAADRRASARFPGSMLTWLEVARLKFGQQVGIVDLSTGGALIESSLPLKPGTVHSLELAGGSKPVVARFGVLRSRVSAISPDKVVYHSACAFTEPLDLPELQRQAIVDGASAEAQSPGAILPFVTPDPEPAAATDGDANADAGVDGEDLDKEAIVPSGWHRVVARYVDGRTTKGFTNDFAVTRPQFTLRPRPEDTADASGVQVADLKAIFFVRNFDGNPDYRERKIFGGPGVGKRIEVRFKDGEVVVGTTPGYRPSGPGFFMTPADPRANNCRIFIVTTALRNVRLL